jgi:hypothetical protein
MGASLRHIDKDIIFRQTFENGEDDVVNNPYSKGFINGSILFQDGYALYKQTIAVPNSCIYYPTFKRMPGAGSIRIKFKLELENINSSSYLFGETVSTIPSGIYYYLTNATRILSGSGVGGGVLYYVNGVSVSLANVIFNDGFYDVIITWTSRNETPGSNGFALGCSFTTNDSLNVTNGFKGRMELCEIYNRVLSAAEVSQLYKGTFYQKPNIPAPIFDLTAEQGFIEEKTGRNITTSNVRILKNSTFSYINVYNGFGSSIDTGSNWVTTGDMSFSGWLYESKVRNDNNSTGQSIISNLSLVVTRDQFTDNRNLYITSMGGVTYAISSNMPIPLCKWYHLGITRSAAGIVNAFVDGIQVITNGFSGVPTVGSSNVKICSPGSRAFYGSIASFKGWNTLLNVEQIQQIYQFEKYKYQ